MRPVPIGLEPGLQAFLAEIRTAVVKLQEPGKPTREFATVFGQLPPAADYPNCRVLVTDKNALAVSTLVAGSWTWLRADGSAL